MKKHIFALTAVMAVLFMFSSCGKYEEGPSFSLLTKKARITGIWKIEKQLVNGVEVALDEMFQGTSIELIKDGTGKISMSIGPLILNVDLEWEFSDDKMQIKLRMKDETDPTKWGEWEVQDILRLTNKECWLQSESIEDSVKVVSEMHLTK